MELFSLQSLFLLLLSIFLYVHFKKGYAKSGIRNYPIVGALPEFLNNRHRFLEWSTEVLATKCPTNTAVFHRPYNFNGIITANPVNVEHMLKTNFDNYPKGDRFTTIRGDFLGGGIFNSDGELWWKQRKTASYEFNTKSLRNFIMRNVIIEISTRLVPVLDKASETGSVLNLQDVFERFAFDNVCKLAFNFDPCCLAGDAISGSNVGDDFMKAFEEAATLSCGRFFYAIPSLWKLKSFFNVGSERRLTESISAVHNFVNSIVQSRMETRNESKAEDLLSRFMENDEISPELLRDIAISFILAGRDTTSSALTWFFWLLTLQLDVKETILDELKEIRTRTGKNIGDDFCMDDMREMHYLQAAISESMRLYPPVPVDTKECLKEDVMPDGTFVGKNWLVMYNTYAMGRIQSIWGDDCEDFRPERWLKDGVYRQESPFRFPAFHAGPRMCLGKDMANIQMKSIAASIIERFEIDLLDKDMCPKYVMALTLRIKGGLPVRVRRRSNFMTN